MKTKIKAPKGWRVMIANEKPDCEKGDEVVGFDGTMQATGKCGFETVARLKKRFPLISHYIRRIKIRKK